MNANPRVAAVILAWNHKEDTLECLGSLLASTAPDVYPIVVDNGSTDGTSQALREAYPQVEVLRSETNLGVTGGYNLGLQRALELGVGYILILNNDTLLDPGMLPAMIQTMQRHMGCAIVMPKIYHYYGDRQRLWCTGARWVPFPPRVKMNGLDQMDGPAYAQESEIEFAPSCCLLLSAELVKTIAGFDTGYFFYNDDWDYCVRARRAGFSLWFSPQAHLWHKVSVSTQNSEKPAMWWNYLGRSTVRFYGKHYGKTTLVAFITWFIIRESLKRKFTRLNPFLQGVRAQWGVEYPSRTAASSVS